MYVDVKVVVIDDGINIKYLSTLGSFVKFGELILVVDF